MPPAQHSENGTAQDDYVPKWGFHQLVCKFEKVTLPAEFRLRKGLLAQTRISAIRKGVNFSNGICSLIFEAGTVKAFHLGGWKTFLLLFRKTSTCTGSLFIVQLELRVYIPATLSSLSIVLLHDLYPWTSMFLGPTIFAPALLSPSVAENDPFELEFVARFVPLGRRSNNWKERIFVLRGECCETFLRNFEEARFFVSFFFPHFLINEVAFKKGEVDISASQKSLKNIKDYN